MKVTPTASREVRHSAPDGASGNTRPQIRVRTSVPSWAVRESAD
jgi:hypothetical protein